MMIIESALYPIHQSNQIALFAHIQPDGDTIGSCLALSELLRAFGKSVDLYCQDEVPVSLHFLQGIEQFQSEYNENMPYDLTIAVDCSDEGRMGIFSNLYQSGRHTMNIDHHISNTMYAETNLVDSTAAATGEIIYSIVKSFDIKPNKLIAEVLYTAISTDTGGFRFQNTTAESYRIGADLIDCGIDVGRITTLLYSTNRIEKIRLLGKALDSLTLYNDNQIAVITITQEDLITTGAKESEIENMINYAKDIVGVELGILFREQADSSTKVSFRSKGKVDVSRLAEEFNGGGHKAAAGANLQLNMSQAKDAVITASFKALEGKE